jgi:putative FmdB family regulatory protein
MPIYQYQCKDCEHVTENIEKHDAKPPEWCSQCGGTEIRRVPSLSSFRLKGDGWYKGEAKEDGK